MRQLKLGTRGSALALKQAELALDALMVRYTGLQVETVVIRTEGDRRTDVSLEAVGGQGVFVKDIEARLLAGEIDIAVHSLKDMPPGEPAGLAIGAVLPRGDARDVLISKDGSSFREIRQGARVGTDSRRRAVQLKALRPDLEIASIRGNVDTRLSKVDSGEYDAVVLAAAGLERLDLSTRVSQYFTVDEVVPAVGQGVLAVQCRADDAEVLEALSAIDDADTRSVVTAERAFLRRLGAGCSLPVGAFGVFGDVSVRLRAMLADDSGRIYRAEGAAHLSDVEDLGMYIAEQLANEAGLSI